MPSVWVCTHTLSLIFIFQTAMKSILFILSLLLPLFISAQTAESAEEILTAYEKYQATPNANKTRNDCHFVLQGGTYVIARCGNTPDTELLTARLPRIDIEDSTVIAFMQEYGADKFTDYYYMLLCLQKGDSFDDARDGISFSTRFPSRALNENDYAKLQDVFSSRNTLLHATYLEKMRFLFQNYGCTDKMTNLQPLIEKEVAESPLKTEILELYARYAPLRRGSRAPLIIGKDRDGKVFTSRRLAGKTIVVDVWATWCCNCIEKMPKFIRLSEEFRDHQDVVFIALSIDRQQAHARWLQASEKYGITAITQVIADPTFERDYCIAGIPRYIVIDGKGRIVSAFAPGPGEELKELILHTLKK